jgi:hypothetical protein
MKIQQDLSMFRAFEIPFEYALELIESALYLDLPNLVELGCKALVSQFAKVKSLSGLPEPILRTILKMLNIGELIVAENQLLLHQASIDTTSAWVDKFWKVLSHYSQTNQPVPQFLQSEKLLNVAKKVCIEFYTSQILQKISTEILGKRNLLSSVLRWDGHTLTQLLIHIDIGSVGLDASFWDEFFASTPNMRQLQIRCNQVNASLPLLLASASKLLKITSIGIVWAVQQMNSGIWADIGPFFVVPMVNNSKVGVPLDKSRFVRLKTEKHFNIQGLSSLAEYLDRPPSKPQETHERIPQTTSPIQLQIMEDTKIARKGNSFRSIATDLFVPHLVTLNLENVHLGLEGALHLANVCSNDTASLSLQEMSLANTNLGTEGFVQVINAMASNKRLRSILKKLNLANIVTESQLFESDVMKTLSVALPGFTSLEHLDVSGNSFSSISLRLFFDNLLSTNVHDLNLSAIPVSTSIHSIHQWLKTRKNIHLGLSNCNLLPRTLLTMFKNLPRDIERLDISYNTMDCQVARELKQWLQNSNMRELNLSGIPNMPIDVLLKDSKKLQRLHIDNCSIQDEEISGVIDIILNGSITHCSLKHNYITSLGLGILEARHKVRKTVHLDLDGNQIDEAAIKRFQTRTQKNGEGLIAVFGKQNVAT